MVTMGDGMEWEAGLYWQHPLRQISISVPGSVFPTATFELMDH